MRKVKLIFYVFYFGYFFVSIYFALYIDAMFKQFGMFPFLRFLKFWIITGMALLLIEWLIENIHIYQLRRNNKKQEAEITKLKAQLYDHLKLDDSTQLPAKEDQNNISNPASNQETI